MFKRLELKFATVNDYCKDSADQTAIKYHAIPVCENNINDCIEFATFDACGQGLYFGDCCGDTCQAEQYMRADEQTYYGR